MSTYTSQSGRRQAGIEDILLAVLGFVAGPLLWWMGQVWNDTQTASSLQTLEYWIALICGFLGVVLSVLWLLFVIAGMAFVIALRTHNRLIAYWSGLFTPKFLRRIIISVFGAQLALTSQAFAATGPQEQANEISISETPVPFMPSVIEPSATTKDEVDRELDGSPPTLDTSDPSSSSSSSASSTPLPVPSSSELVPEPRQHSQIMVEPAPTTLPSPTGDLVPTPRQSSVVDVSPKPLQQAPQQQSHDDKRSDVFTPQQPIQSPEVSLNQRADIADDPTFVVKRGDCLWDIAHQELGADASLFQIDQRWRQWWKHNHSIIGDDPHTIKPGTVLFAPPFSH